MKKPLVVALARDDPSWVGTVPEQLWSIKSTVAALSKVSGSSENGSRLGERTVKGSDRGVAAVQRNWKGLFLFPEGVVSGTRCGRMSNGPVSWD